MKPFFQRSHAVFAGLLLTALRASGRPWLRLPARGLVAFLRKTPLLVQLFIWYFVLPELLPFGLGDAFKQQLREDIAAMRQVLTRRYSKMAEALQEADRRKDEFLATLAHELRNPLGPIRSSVELLCRLDPEVPPIQEQARMTILRHTGHLVRLVEDLLDMNRIESGELRLDVQRIELSAVIAAAIDSPAVSSSASGSPRDRSACCRAAMDCCAWTIATFCTAACTAWYDDATVALAVTTAACAAFTAD